MNTTRAAGSRPRHGVRLAAACGLLPLVAGSIVATALPAAAADLPASFLSTSSTWSYSDNGTNPSPGDADRLAWTRAGFDDSAWKTGAGAFGAKSGSATPNLGSGFPVTTVLNQYYPGTTTDIETFHLRTSFDITADQLGQIDGLAGSVVFDDGVQVFVNGVKVAGFADDAVNAAAEGSKNLVYAGNNLSDPVSGTFTVPEAVLHAGSNEVAVALYQGRANSSDVYLDLKSLAPITEGAGSASISDLVLGVGADETQRNLAWYSSADTAQTVQFAPATAYDGTTFPASAVSAAATGGLTTSGEYNRFATIDGLAANTAYVYRVGAEGAWSAVQSFRTQDFAGDFDFLFFGDPQIGSSGNVANDQAGWVDTVNVATQTYPDAELLFSAGDQVESASNEAQYAAFLAADQLTEIPFVATNGNHDVGSKAYSQHFNTPNLTASAGAGTSTSSGGDYWFIYKDVLFMNLNSNSRDYSTHIPWMEQVVAEHGDEAKWKVLAFHHSIYSSGPHGTDSDVVDRRNNLPTTISDLGIDLVLQGHDHSYARSYLMHNGEKADPAEVAGADQVVAGPGGVLYVTANSASGSKYYDINSQVANFSWLSVKNQEKVRNYTAVEVTDGAITVKTLRSQANGDANPINSVVDAVTLTRAEGEDGVSQDLQVAVPEQAAGEFSWSIDGTNGIVDLGTAEQAADAFTASGAINPIRVSDTRKGSPVWSISAQSGDFAAGADEFGGEYLGWTPQVTEAGGGALAGAAVSSKFDGGTGLATSSVLGSALAGHAKGAAKLSADLFLKVPVDLAPEGVYSTKLTLTALS
ncbi:fibronectin type III domain-containing protein [Agromyces seonyuensis]|uniref:Metallophosphoesterase n=1 Tax=Agromyces seonyuensis TaxID=2662446 RepID=A0A6I4NUI2_9MICO|nr:fibronectin type III domain-containing protein [Agromyces seonyuensis]MWB97940.1 metallophosphoesterase [Agromyces seonyuensis]